MIYPLPVEFAEDSLIFIKTILTGWLLVIIAKGTFECLVFALEFGQWAIRKYVKSMNSKLIAGRGINFMWQSLSKAYREIKVEKIDFYSETVSAAEVAK
jgi:hypothetical protein